MAGEAGRHRDRFCRCGRCCRHRRYCRRQRQCSGCGRESVVETTGGCVRVAYFGCGLLLVV
eukprot:5834161-Karenia_brevis.AAC.1